MSAVATGGPAPTPGRHARPDGSPTTEADGPDDTAGGEGPPAFRGGDDGRLRARDLPRGWWRWPAMVLAVVLLAAAAAFAVAGAGGAPAAPALGPGDVTVEMDIEHSVFAPGRLRVVEGTTVRFVVVNGDPINHELIVGPPDVHARHEDGHEAQHPSVPGEVSVAADATGVTAYRFDDVGTFEFACHLPGHYAYGMHGEVEVVPA